MLDAVYTSEYVKAQLGKHKNRYNNHWKNHIYYAKKMITDYFGDNHCTILDLGCSVGTYAIEFALAGYETIGLDLDPKALDCARQLAADENVNPVWICADAGQFILDSPVDIILAFDLLEHLDNETIKNMFNSIKANLKPDGIFMYHTFPTEYDHIFYKNLFFKPLTSIIPLPLIPFKKLKDPNFTQVVKYYSNFLDIFSLLTIGKTHKKIMESTVHPNPLSRKRLDVFFHDCGFESLFSRDGIEDFNSLKSEQGKLAVRYFSNKSVAQRSLWGVAKVIGK